MTRSGSGITVKRLILVLVGIALVGGFLRLWEPALSQFQDIDDIRDWRRAGAVLEGRAPWWLGPNAGISTGRGARLPGGFYYGLLAGAHRINSSPLPGLLLISCAGTLAAVLTFFAARVFLTTGSAVLAGFLAATSPVWVVGSRRIWNPNVLVLFSVLFVWAIAWWFLRKSRAGLLTAFFLEGLLLQLHLSALALVPVLLVAGISAGRRMKLLGLALLLLMLPLLHFFMLDAGQGWRRTIRLKETLVTVTTGSESTAERSLPFPLCWPLPYLPPLATVGYSDDTLDRAAAALLSHDAPELRTTELLGLYWKTGLGRLIRSNSLADLPKKVSAHDDLSRPMKLRFWLDTGASLILLGAMIMGLAGIMVDARKSKHARVLLLLVAPLLIATLLPGGGATHHFYFIFFPLPAIIVARSAAWEGRGGRVMTIALTVAIAVNTILLVDRRMEIKRLGGTPSYGVAHGYRVEAAEWLASRGVGSIGEIAVIGGKDAWRWLLEPGGERPKYRVVEIGALDTICESGSETCGEEWLTKRDRWRRNLVYSVPGIWIYRIPTGPRESTTQR